MYDVTTSTLGSRLGRCMSIFFQLNNNLNWWHFDKKNDLGIYSYDPLHLQIETLYRERIYDINHAGNNFYFFHMF